MRRSSFQRPNVVFAGGRGRWTLLLVGILAFLVLFRVIFPGAFAFVFSPLFSLGNAGTDAVGSFFSSFSEAQKTREELLSLAREYEELSATNELLSARIEDIEALLAGSSLRESMVLAGVLSGPPVSPYDTLLLSGGARDGITQAALVYGPGSVPIGTITQVHERSSRALLFSTPGRESTAWLGEDRVSVTLVGGGAGAYEITLSRDIPVAVGDTVYLPGPGALPVGHVARVIEDPASPEVRLEVKGLINIFSLTFVLVGSEPFLP